MEKVNMNRENSQILKLLSSLNEQIREMNIRLEKLEKRSVPKRLLSLDEAADYLDVGKTVLKEMGFDGKIEVYQREPKSHVKILKDSLDRHIEKNVVKYKPSKKEK